MEITDQALSMCKSPVIYFSGGKDSIVMAHLLKFVFGLDLPVIFHREPWMTHKYAFGERVIRAWGLTCYDYAPIQVAMWHNPEKDWLAWTNFYQIGTKPDGQPQVLALPKNIIEFDEEGKFLCGLEDIVKRPTGTFNYPWDAAFIGHKSVDEDQIAGKVTLHESIVRSEHAPLGAFPLRHWTHDDVWDYIEENNLPVQTDRYDKQARTELADKTFNSDSFEVCARCIDRRNTSETVICPKTQKPVPNVSKLVPYQDIKLDYYGEPKTTESHV